MYSVKEDSGRNALAKGKQKTEAASTGLNPQDLTKVIEIGDAEELSDVNNLPSFSKGDELDLNTEDNDPSNAPEQPFDGSCLLHRTLVNALTVY